MIKTFLRVYTETFGILDFMESSVYSYAKTTFGALVAVKTREFDSGKTTVKATLLSGGFALNTFALALTKCESVHLACKRVALEVPPEYGGFKFGKKVFRTVTVPTSEVSFEVSFNEADEAEANEVLVGLA